MIAMAYASVNNVPVVGLLFGFQVKLSPSSNVSAEPRSHQQISGSTGEVCVSL
jgi:CTP synthase (UTP-ammonia lyase)